MKSGSLWRQIPVSKAVLFVLTFLMRPCECLCVHRRFHATTGPTVTSTLCPVTCWTLFSKRILAQPPRDRWAQGPTAVERQLAEHPTAEPPRAENRPVEPLAVGKVWLFFFLISLNTNCRENVPFASSVHLNDCCSFTALTVVASRKQQ